MAKKKDTGPKVRNGKFASLKVAAEDTENPDVSKETNYQLDPFSIEIEPGFNRPISRSHIEKLKTAIRAGAVIPAIFVRTHRTSTESRIFMVDGEHRMWAVRELIDDFRAGLPSGMDIKVMSAVEFKGGDDERVAHLLNSGESLAISPLDQGVQMLKLIRMKWTRQAIADRVGRSITHVNECIALAEANTDVQEAVRSGELTSTLAAEMLRDHGEDAGKVIQAKLKSTGKKKLTRAMVKGRSIPKKLVTRFTAGVDTLLKSLPDMTAQELAERPAGSMVQVPATVLAELAAAHEEIVKLRTAASAGDEEDDTVEGQRHEPT